METFLRLFGSLLRLVYHCFDRMVIFGYLPLLSRPEHIVYFFRDVHGVGAITKRRSAPAHRPLQPLGRVPLLPSRGRQSRGTARATGPERWT